MCAAYQYTDRLFLKEPPHPHPTLALAQALAQYKRKIYEVKPEVPIAEGWFHWSLTGEEPNQ